MKTIGLILFTATTVMCLGNISRAEFAEGVKLQADGKDIDGEVGHLVPNVLDWDGDGKKDLIVGQFGSGNIKLYLNKGTDEAPKLTAAGKLKAGGKEISLPSG
jgi:hypothetical protein